jgi:hypothetical protein
MLSPGDWNAIRAYTDQVCNREADDIVFQAGRVRRMPGDDVIIMLKATQVDLEPAMGDRMPLMNTDALLSSN